MQKYGGYVPGVNLVGWDRETTMEDLKDAKLNIPDLAWRKEEEEEEEERRGGAAGGGGAAEAKGFVGATGGSGVSAVLSGASPVGARLAARSAAGRLLGWLGASSRVAMVLAIATGAVLADRYRRSQGDAAAPATGPTLAPITSTIKAPKAPPPDAMRLMVQPEAAAVPPAVAPSDPAPQPAKDDALSQLAEAAPNMPPAPEGWLPTPAPVAEAEPKPPTWGRDGGGFKLSNALGGDSKSGIFANAPSTFQPMTLQGPQGALTALSRGSAPQATLSRSGRLRPTLASGRLGVIRGAARNSRSLARLRTISVPMKGAAGVETQVMKGQVDFDKNQTAAQAKTLESPTDADAPVNPPSPPSGWSPGKECGGNEVRTPEGCQPTDIVTPWEREFNNANDEIKQAVTWLSLGTRKVTETLKKALGFKKRGLSGLYHFTLQLSQFLAMAFALWILRLAASIKRRGNKVDALGGSPLGHSIREIAGEIKKAAIVLASRISGHFILAERIEDHRQRVHHKGHEMLDALRKDAEAKATGEAPAPQDSAKEPATQPAKTPAGNPLTN